MMAGNLLLSCCVLVMVLNTTEGAEVFISQFKSNDTYWCGSSLSPCASLEYALKHKVKSNDIVRLDAGKTKEKPYVYVFKKTLPYIDKNLTITNYGENYLRPTILWNGSLWRKQYLFYVNSRVDLHFRITDINFSKVPLFLMRRVNSLTLVIRRCNFSKIYVPTIKNKDSIRINVKINISQCYFYQTYILNLIKYCRGYILLQQCVVNEGPRRTKNHIIFLQSFIKRFNLIIDNCRFENASSCSIYVQGSNTKKKIVNKFTIKNSTFVNFQQNLRQFNKKHVINGYFLEQVIIKDCLFSGYLVSPVKISTTLDFQITNTKFLKNRAEMGGAINLVKSSGKIENCVFEKNFAKLGGAIYNEAYESDIFITNATFLSNTAQGLGGNIYFTQKEKFYLQSTMSLQNVRIIGNAVNNISYGYFMYSSGMISLTNVSMTLKAYSLKDNVDGFLCTESCLSQSSSFQNVHFKCARNYKTAFLTTIIRLEELLSVLRCRRCPKGTYGSALQTMEINYNALGSRSLLNIRKTNMSCLQCPTGGVCEENVTSKGNFWGYKTRSEQLLFIPCPSQYCCSKKTKRCVSYNTCNSHREGTLCGSCRKGYRVNYFNKQCVGNKNCRVNLFWFLFVLYAIFYTVVLLFYKDIVNMILRTARRMKSKRAAQMTEPILPNEEENSDCLQIDEEEIHADIDSPEENLTVHNQDFKSGHKDKIISSIGGMKTILFFFYQMEILLSVEHHLNEAGYGYLSKLRQFFSSLLNFRLLSIGVFRLCPKEALTTIEKESTRLGLILMIVFFLFQCFLAKSIYQKLRLSKREYVTKSIGTLPFKGRVRVSLIHLILLSYTSISTYCFKMTNCVDINGKKHLYIQGDVVCYVWWHYFIMVIISIWIVPFPISTYLSEKMLESNRITVKQFYLNVIFPPKALWCYLRTRYSVKKRTRDVERDNDEERQSIINVFTKPYNSDQFGGKNGINWEVVILFRRIIVTALCIYIVNPVIRMMILLPILFSFILHHLYVLPFCSQFLNRVETASLSLLLFFNVSDLFWAINYMNDLTQIPAYGVITAVLSWTEDIILTLPLVIVFFGFAALMLKKVFDILLQCFVKKID